MTLLELLPVLAYLLAVLVILIIALRSSPGRSAWWFPALVGATFIIFSAVTFAEEGVIQFWINHTTSLAGNQVWFDLLSAVTISFYLIAPRARAVGMKLLPWGIAVFATACIALLPMVARLMWLEAAQRRA